MQYEKEPSKEASKLRCSKEIFLLYHHKAVLYKMKLPTTYMSPLNNLLKLTYIWKNYETKYTKKKPHFYEEINLQLLEHSISCNVRKVVAKENFM